MLKDIIETKDMDLAKYVELSRISKSLTRKDYDNIIKELENFKSELYTSNYSAVLRVLGLDSFDIRYNPSKYIHGVYHVEKVFLYTYLIVKLYNEKVDASKQIPDELQKVLYYASFYHDIGRLNNAEERSHGANSAYAFCELFKKDPFFLEDERRMFLVECLMELHSLPEDKKEDFVIEEILYKHNLDWENVDIVKDFAKGFYVVLANILKDADALDRKRFGEWTRESLNPDFLRLEESKSLVGFATELNKLYYELQKNNFKNISLSDIKGKDCFHSIGFDFFKIKSILTHGILSQDELKKRNILTPRNFPGGNFDRWISVVDISLYPKCFENRRFEEKFAADEFAHHGITFYCHNIPFISPCESKNREQALEDGFPWNKSGYIDEKYVLDKVPPENILGLFIPYSSLDADVRTLRYIYESTNMDIVRARVMYYKRYTFGFDKSGLNDKLDELLNEYEKLILIELSQPRGSRNSKEYFCESKRIMDKINQIIGLFVYSYYSEKMDNVCIKNIIEYELSNTKDISFEAIGSADRSEKEMFYMIHRTYENDYKESNCKKI